MLFLTRDQYIGRSLAVYGEYSESEAAVFSQIVGAGHVVVEVGANMGAHTVHLAKLAGPGGAMHAFEPQRAIFHLLCANIALNGLDNVYAHQEAVGRAPGLLKTLPLDYGAENNFGGLSLIGTEHGEDVPVITLDSLDLPSLRLLKVDVEGMEVDVLLGAERTIARHRPILYVENDRRENSGQLITLLESYGYDLWWHLAPLHNPDNFAGYGEDIFPGVISMNLLCTPKEMSINAPGLRKVAGPTDWWEQTT
jgi:FkbM family methyltransferase